MPPKAPKIDLDLEGLTPEQLEALAEEARAKAEELRTDARRSVFVDLNQRATKAGYRLEELVEEFGVLQRPRVISGIPGVRKVRKDKGQKFPPKYRDPKSGLTWSGRGRAPGWIVEHEAQGGKRDDLLIKK